jgi:putative lipoprotein
MRFSRPFYLALLPLLASCQVFTDKPAEPASRQTRMQGELSLNAGQLLFRPCQEQRQFILKADHAAELSSDASTLFADGHASLYVDMRGELQANTQTGVDGQFAPSQVYRIQAEGPGCTDINFSRTLLRASGHEPDWTIAVSNQGLILNRPGQEPQALPYLEEQLPEGRLNLSSEANGQRLELWVARQRCVDSMSGTVQHLSAELRLNGEVSRGCAYLGGARND